MGAWLLAAIFALLWLLIARAPQVAADPQRQTRVLGALLGTELATLVVYYLAFSAPELGRFMGISAKYGWLWLAVPLAAIVTARVRHNRSEG